MIKVVDCQSGMAPGNQLSTSVTNTVSTETIRVEWWYIFIPLFAVVSTILIVILLCHLCDCCYFSREKKALRSQQILPLHNIPRERNIDKDQRKQRRAKEITEEQEERPDRRFKEDYSRRFAEDKRSQRRNSDELISRQYTSYNLPPLALSDDRNTTGKY